MVNFTTVYETEASSTSNCPAIFIYLSKKLLFISAFYNKSKVTRSCIQCDKPSRRRLALIIIQNTVTEKEIISKFRIMAYVLNALTLGQTLVKRLQDYELPFIRAGTIDHTGQKLRVLSLFLAWFGNSYFTPK